MTNCSKDCMWYTPDCERFDCCECDCNPEIEESEREGDKRMTREEAIEILKKYKDESEEDYWVKRAEALGMAIESLESQKTGHWIIYAELTGEWEGTKKYACDKCGEKVGVFKSKYCPNCGARMEEE